MANIFHFHPKWICSSFNSTACWLVLNCVLHSDLYILFFALLNLHQAFTGQWYRISSMEIGFHMSYKNWCFWTVVLEKTLESPLDSKEIQPVNPKGNQSWIFIRRTDVEDETPIPWWEELTHWKRPWFWERLKTGGEEGFSRVTAGFSSYDGEFRLALVLAQASPIFHSSCEGKLGIALEWLQGQ